MYAENTEVKFKTNKNHSWKCIVKFSLSSAHKQACYSEGSIGTCYSLTLKPRNLIIIKSKWGEVFNSWILVVNSFSHIFETPKTCKLFLIENWKLLNILHIISNWEMPIVVTNDAILLGGAQRCHNGIYDVYFLQSKTS